jgi:hypothetical protein
MSDYITYREMEEKCQERINALEIRFAFSDAQLAEGLKELGITLEEAYPIFGGGFMRKSDIPLYREALRLNRKDVEDYISDPKRLANAFYQEAANHEFCYSGNVEEVWEAVGLDYNRATEEQLEAWNKAVEHYESCVVC